ncbi:hypothetical protein JCM11641_000772 [Rhodosporidiobolus odoratus]
MSTSTDPAGNALEDELKAFREKWRRETQRGAAVAPAEPHQTSKTSASRAAPASQPASPEQPRRSLDHDTDAVRQELQKLEVEGKGKQGEVVPEVEEEVVAERRARERPRSALDLYSEAVRSEREGRMQDALVNYRSAFRLDPDVDRAYHRANLASQQHGATRGAEPHAPSSAPGDFRFERTVQLGPDYDAKKEHRSKKEAERETGNSDRNSTHPSSTAFLLNWLLKSIGENPYERPHPAVVAAPAATSPSSSPSKATAALPSEPAADDRPPKPTVPPEEALATLSFLPADEDKPLPLLRLPHEVLILVLQHLLLTSILPPPRLAHPEADQAAAHTAGRGKRALKKRTLKEEMLSLETELELEDAEREWKSDVEALERFARVCRAARVITLDSALWRALCLRTFVPPQQIPREQDAQQLVHAHGDDWRRFFIEHPRIRFDGAYISVVTYLRRGEVASIYAPSHLVTFYRYLRFYHHGLVLSLLTTDPPNTVVRRLNPSLRMKGLSFGRWRLREEDKVEIWGLEDPGVPEASRKYSFRMDLRLRSTARGRMNKLEMLSLATEHRVTLELEDVPIRPTKPFFYSRVAVYAGEDRPEHGQEGGAEAKRMKGLSFGRWRLREEDKVEIWGLEDPGVPEASRKYSFRMDLRLRSTARGRMNKLEMLSLATEHRVTLELEDVPIRPTKPFFYSRVAVYAGEDRPEHGQEGGAEAKR